MTWPSGCAFIRFSFIRFSAQHLSLAQHLSHNICAFIRFPAQHLRIERNATRSLHGAVSCIVLQCVAMRCSVLQGRRIERCAMWCVPRILLQCVALCSSVLQCLVVWCSVLQCVAVVAVVVICCSASNLSRRTRNINVPICRTRI